MEPTAARGSKRRGGGFLIEEIAPEEIFTPEDFTDEHQAVAQTTDEFWSNEVAPNVEGILNQEPGLAVSIMRKSAELGLLGVPIPEMYGGMEMDLVSLMIVAEHMGKDGSYSAWHSPHCGIGTMPVLLFGTDDQKQRYLPKLATGEMVGSYALSEASAGSDALAIKSRAELSEDGQHYILNGQKVFITNAGAAGLFTVFAKIDGEKFTAFLVERGYEGLNVGPEEKKMGIKGSSTCPVYLDGVKVPVDNVLGEIGRGHLIAFNILNLGRLKLGPMVVGNAKYVLEESLKYAKQRKAFGKTIADFGMIQHKLAEMAIRTFAAETISYRVTGMIEGLLEGFSWDQPDAAQVQMKAAEEFAAECSYVKVFATEALDYVVDEGVQIHGGYGFHQDYMVERAYRDSRIHRIYEGTNEINRLLATSMLLKRAQKGRLPLVEAVQALQAEILAGPGSRETANGSFAEETRMVANAKKAALLAIGTAYRKYVTALDQQQEIVAGITEIAMNAFTMESVCLRARKLAAAGKGDVAGAICQVFLREAMEKVESFGRAVLAACGEGDPLRTNLAVLRRFTKFEPVDVIALRRKIAGRLLEAERYLV